MCRNRKRSQRQSLYILVDSSLFVLLLLEKTMTTYDKSDRTGFVSLFDLPIKKTIYNNNVNNTRLTGLFAKTYESS